VSHPDAAQGEAEHVEPELLPDGRTVLFAILTTDGHPRIGLLSLETAKHRVLLDGAFFGRYASTGHLVYTQGDSLMAAPFDLAGLELTGDPYPILERIWTNPDVTAHYAFSSEGTLVYVPAPSQEGNLVWVDRMGGTRPVTETRRDYEDPRLERWTKGCADCTR
jgi:eukaryotic-like serine/threonine-protein kinase